MTVNTLRIFGMSSETAAKYEVISLPAGHNLRLKSQDQTLMVIGGCAWVSVGGEDVVLLHGDSLTLNKGRGDAYVSALGGKSVMFEVR